jgi:hypothetical protein
MRKQRKSAWRLCEVQGRQFVGLYENCRRHEQQCTGFSESGCLCANRVQILPSLAWPHWRRPQLSDSVKFSDEALFMSRVSYAGITFGYGDHSNCAASRNKREANRKWASGVASCATGCSRKPLSPAALQPSYLFQQTELHATGRWRLAAASECSISRPLDRIGLHVPLISGRWISFLRVCVEDRLYAAKARPLSKADNLAGVYQPIV